MERDPRSTFHRLAPAPQKSLDTDSLIREGQRRRRTRNASFAGATAALVLAAALTIPNVLQRQDEGRPVKPVQPPASAVSPTPPSSSSDQDDWAMVDGPGWHRAEAPPDPRIGAVVVWSGRQTSGRDLVVWSGESGSGTVNENDGFSWDARTNEWTPLAASPLEARAEAGSAWTGQEIIIWGGYGEWPKVHADGAAYDPHTDKWRMLPQAPLSPAAPVATVWTGEEVLVWGSIDRSTGSTEGAAYNPATNEWRKLPDAPRVINLGAAVWTDGSPEHAHEMVIVGAELDNRNDSDLDHAVGIAYDPEMDEWRELPQVPLSPQATTIAWVNEKLIAWDYALDAAEYDRVTNEWSELPQVPLRGSECYPTSAPIGSSVVAWYCGQAASWDTSEERWRKIELPDEIVAGEPVLAGEVLLFAGATHEATHNGLWIYSEPGRP